MPRLMPLALAALLIVATACGRVGYGAALSSSDGSVDSELPDSGPDGGMDGGMDADAGSADTGASITDAQVDAADGTADTALPPCSEAPCRLVAPQCGCAAGLACQRPLGDDPLRECVPVGASAVGEICAFNAECTTAAVCVATGTSRGICTEYCETSAECGGRTCAELFVMSEDIGACESDCDPVATTGCPTGTGCGVGLTRSVPAREFAYIARCVDTTLSGEGGACPAPTFLCGPGLVCLGETCRRTCDRPAGACPAGRSCLALDPVFTSAGREVGACQ